MPEYIEYNGVQYRETRDVLRQKLEGETVERVDVDVNESSGIYVTEITLHMGNGDEIVFRSGDG